MWEGERRRTSAANWREPLKWNAKAKAAGTTAWVFCASLADVFDNQVPPEWRADLWRLITATPHLRWQLLTKRIGNAAAMLPDDWHGPDGIYLYEHVGIMATVVDQAEADRDLPKLVGLKASYGVPWIGISYEPALGPIDLSVWLASGLDWVIAGGETSQGGHLARPPHADWFFAVRDQCVAAGVPFFFKQWGRLVRGRLLDGCTHDAFPRVYEPAFGHKKSRPVA